MPVEKTGGGGEEIWKHIDNGKTIYRKNDCVSWHAQQRCMHSIHGYVAREPVVSVADT